MAEPIDPVVPNALLQAVISISPEKSLLVPNELSSAVSVCAPDAENALL